MAEALLYAVAKAAIAIKIKKWIVILLLHFIERFFIPIN